uniref:Uncharacterized protein n=1 Tax=Hyaloperonospora arabidopsidis (strain Emoy2) TaxID=559515 RepID=M4B4U3_HYAAE
MANLFIKHTSASLSINENCDPDVRMDMEGAFNRIVPESWNKRHAGPYQVDVDWGVGEHSDH